MACTSGADPLAFRLTPLLPGLVSLLCACEGPQSALSPAGRDAEHIAHLFWWMASGALVVWAAVMGSALYAVLRRERRHTKRAATLFILGGGVVAPTVLLTALLVDGLSMMPAMLDLGPAEGRVIEVTGEQWWWRVRYPTEGGAVELANEIHLPVGRRVRLRLQSPDVIHSLWAPSLAGKMDVIPGRVTRLALEPTRAGVFRGACAEYCGASHARMSFYVVASPQAEFDAWLAHQAEPARPPSDPRGAAAFLAQGCGACHTVRGTPADGAVGPDLTHVGSRQSIGAGVLDNDVEGFRRWLTHTGQLKPGVHMPTFDMLPSNTLDALASYLESLR